MMIERGDKYNDITLDYPIYDKDDLLKIFPFGKTKLNELLQANVLPVIKVGRDYITNQKMLDEWFKKFSGKEIKYN